MAVFDIVKTFFTTAVLAPFIAIKYLFTKPKSYKVDQIFGMGVNLDKLPHKSPELIKQLGVKNLLVRIALWDMHNIKRYLDFVQSFEDANITLCILQDREHITDLQKTQKDFATIFELFAPHIQGVIVGNAINRKKWGFATINEYMQFYNCAKKVQKNYPHIALAGSSVIDFEYHFSIRTLFNGYFPKYDKVAALLYVDRRGAPENTQLGFNFMQKIALLHAIISLSKSKNRLIISELNWPIANTAPYAPTSEYECVSLKDYRNFLVRSYLLAIASKRVETIYWHQLCASGYGLIDLRDGVQKREAFYAYAFMVKMLQDATLLQYRFDTTYSMQFEKNDTIIEVFWAQDSTDIELQGQLYDILGNKIEHCTISPAVTYKESKKCKNT